MSKKISTAIFITIFGISLLVLSLNIQFLNVYSIPSELPLSYSDVEMLNKDKTFGKNVSAEISDKTVTVGGAKSVIKTLVFKLFGFIPIRTIEANVSEDREVFLGGIPIGFTVDVDGLIVVGGNSVLTESGAIDLFSVSGLKQGDIISAINGVKISTIQELKDIIEDDGYLGEELKLTIIRNKEEAECVLTPVLDIQDDKYKMGLWVKNDASGVGTLTYVDSETMKYGALGHPITDYETGTFVPAKGGKIFSCSIVGLSKGEKGTPGEMKGVFLQGKNEKGTIQKNTECGVFGEIIETVGIVDQNKSADVGSRLTMKPGKATLVSSVSGVREEYEIEIIKANYQAKSSDKSFIFRVTDQRLLDMTGGVIQGMSGSPILLNGKIVGAVTHVFVSDPTKGYGIYVDWMMCA